MGEVLSLQSETWGERTFDTDYRGTVVSNPYPSLLIGCPVQRREWIIDEWWRHAVTAARKVTDDFGFIFVIDPKDETYERICSLSDDDRVATFFVQIEEEDRDDRRRWSHDRLHKMTMLRNLMLKWVRKLGPDHFLSLDSDMLLAEDGILVLMDVADKYDAVGGKAYLTTTGTNCPTYGVWRGPPENGRYTRDDRDYTCKVDVLMAIKLMSPKAYSVDYEYARQGEDIGWSLNCWRNGLTFGWVGEVTNRHVMSPDRLGAFDIRIDR